MTPLTADEILKDLWLQREIGVRVKVFMRCDLVGTLANSINNSTNTTIVVDAVVWNQVKVGDLLQIGKEAMLVTAKTGSTILFVVRQYAGTVFESPGYPSDTGVWVWRDFTERPGFRDHCIFPPASVKTSYDRGLYRFETTVGELRARNDDRFWDSTTLEQGFSSYRNHWIRFYGVRRYGGAFDMRAIGTVLFDDVSTDASGEARISTMGMGSLLKEFYEADAANGRENFAYMPTWYLVKMLLSQVDEFQSGGENSPGATIPLHWHRQLDTRRGRQIPLPAGTRTISHFGRCDEFYPLQGEFSYGWSIRNDHSGVSGNGFYGTAECYDPQVTPANAKTPGSNTGRVFYGVANEIWEFNPANGARAKCVAIANNPTLRIRRLWYNMDDTTITAGKPRIAGAAWLDRPASSSNSGYNVRIEGNAADVTTNMTVFTFDGTTFPRFSDITKAYAGTHCFRDADAGGVIGSVTTSPGMENLSLPFRQRIYGEYPSAAIGVMSELRQGLGGGADPQDPPWRRDPDDPANGTAINLDANGYDANPGIVIETQREADQLVVPNTDMSHWRITGAAGSGKHLRFTMGQQGCVSFCSANFATNDVENGAIAYWQMDTTTGILSLKLWKIKTLATATLLTLGSKDEQPICMQGCRAQQFSTTILAYGSVTWTQTAADSTAQLYQVTATGTRTSLLTTANFPSYWTPLWIGMEAYGGGHYVAVSCYNRDLNSDSPNFRNYCCFRVLLDTTTAFSASNLRQSMIHAITSVGMTPAAGSVLWALDTGGPLLKIDPSSGVSMVITTVDRGFAPVDGEHWCAAEQLAPVDNDTCYGISAPFYPYNDVRGGQTDGLFVAWQYASTMTDVLEIADFKKSDGSGKSLEDGMKELMFASQTYYGFDRNGDFVLKDRVQASAPRIKLDRHRGDASFSKRRGYKDIENVVKIVPSVFEWGPIRVDVHLTQESKIKSREWVEAAVTTPIRKAVQLRCVQPGRPGAARFSYMTLEATLHCVLTQQYTNGSFSGIQITPMFASASGPYNESDLDGRRAKYQIPNGSVIRIGAYEGTISTVVVGGTDSLSVSVTPAFVVSSLDVFRPGFPVTITSPYSHRWQSVSSAATGGTDIFAPTTQFKEIGAGTSWATGVLMRFVEAHDDGRDPNYNQEAFALGDRIVITSDGLVLRDQPAAAVERTNLDGSQKREKRPWRGVQGPVSIRRADALADVILANGYRPRFRFEGAVEGLVPFLDIFDVITYRDLDLIPSSIDVDHEMDLTIEGITDSLGNTMRSTLSLLGAAHE